MFSLSDLICTDLISHFLSYKLKPCSFTAIVRVDCQIIRRIFVGL